MDYEKRRELASVLERYADLDNTEYGTGSRFLADILTRDVGFSSEFVEMAEKEAERRLTWYEENTYVEEVEVTSTYERLEHYG